MYGMKLVWKMAAFFGVWIALCLVATAAMLAWDKHRGDGGYDERQMMHRGRGTILGFWAMMIFNLVVLIWDGIEPGLWTGQWMATLSTMLGGTVCITYFMITDSWAKFNEKTWWVGPCFFLSGAMQIYNYKQLDDSLLALVQQGKETPQTRHITILLCGMCMIYYGLLHLICHWWHNRE